MIFKTLLTIVALANAIPYPHGELTAMLNAFRQQYGSSPLSYSDVLASSADEHAKFLASTGQLSRSGPTTPMDLASKHGMKNLLRAGAAVTLTDDTDLPKAFSAFQDGKFDPVNLEVLKDAGFTIFGLGMVQNGVRSYWVMHFGEEKKPPAPPVTPSPSAPAPVPVAGPTTAAAVSPPQSPPMSTPILPVPNADTKPSVTPPNPAKVPDCPACNSNYFKDPVIAIGPPMVAEPVHEPTVVVTAEPPNILLPKQVVVPIVAQPSPRPGTIAVQQAPLQVPAQAGRPDAPVSVPIGYPNNPIQAPIGYDARGVPIYI